MLPDNLLSKYLLRVRLYAGTLPSDPTPEAPGPNPQEPLARKGRTPPTPPPRGPMSTAAPVFCPWHVLFHFHDELLDVIPRFLSQVPEHLQQGLGVHSHHHKDFM